MADGLKHTAEAIVPGAIRRVYGYAHWEGSHWYARINGKLLDPRWPNHVQPIQGMSIAVDLTKDERGQSTALVVCGYDDQPRPSTGSILSFGVDEFGAAILVFTGEDSSTYSTSRYIGAIETYALGDPVFIDWSAGQPTIMGLIPQVREVRAAAPAVPPGTVSGETVLTPTGSDTWGVGGWGRWATSQKGGEDVYSGTQGIHTVTGAWFYGAPRPELQGKTIHSVEFRVPPRLRAVGDYNNPVTVYLYAHTNQSRPGSDVSRVPGPLAVVIQPRSAGGLIGLDPAVYGPHLAAGGGLSIAGGNYTGFESRLTNPEYGQAILKWSS